MLWIILKQLFVLYIFIFLGWLFGKIKKENLNHTGLLSFLPVNLFLPAKVFNAFANNFSGTTVGKAGVPVPPVFGGNHTLVAFLNIKYTLLKLKFQQGFSLPFLNFLAKKR